MSFWQATNNPSYWDTIKSIWQPHTPPHLLPSKLHFITTVPGILIKRGIIQNAHEYSKFIETHFESRPNISMNIPPNIIENQIARNSWIVIEARNTDNILIGIVVSKLVDLLFSSEFPLQPIKHTGLVDYFCVAPRWRKKGVATALLFKLHNITSIQGRLGHIFSSEKNSLFNKIPTFVKDIYYFRKRNTIKLKVEVECERDIIINTTLIQQLLKYNSGTSVVGFNSGEKTNISHYEFHDFEMEAHILIKPTYEVYYGQKVGEVIAFWGSNDYLDIILDFIDQFDIFLVPSEFPRMKQWTKGAPFGYYSFQFHPGAFDMKRLLLLTN